MVQCNAGGITFDLACEKGQRLGEKLTRLRGDLAQRVYVYQDNDEATTPYTQRVLAEIQSMKAKLRADSIEISRHVGHCSDGCSRLTAFYGGNNDRAPHRSKPELPPMSELAERIKTDATLEELAREYERSPHTLSQRISAAGYNTATGEPRERRRLELDGPRPMAWWQPWMDDANCASTDPEAFFPEKGGSTREAKRVCSRCLVAAECLDWSLENNDRFGIWGGLSERERRRLAQQLDRQEAS